MLRKTLFLLAILGLVLAACGGDEEEAPTTPAATGTPAAEATDAVVSEGVSIQTTDGVTIRGHLFGEGETLVILAHMRPSDQTSWFDFAEELAGMGFSALTFDFRGYGETGGRKDLPHIDRDIEAAIEAMHGEGYETIYLVGASMGGTAALVAAARQDVAGVVAVSAPAKFEGLDAEKVIEQVSEPKLFMASEGDSSAMTSLDTLFELAPQPKEKKTFSGSAHGTELLEGDQAGEFKALIEEFLSGQ